MPGPVLGAEVLTAVGETGHGHIPRLHRGVDVWGRKVRRSASEDPRRPKLLGVGAWGGREDLGHILQS